MMIVRLFDPWIGGMERQSLSLARALNRIGHDVRILTGRWFRGTPRHQTYGGIEVIRNGAMYDGFGIRGVRRVAALFYMITLALALLKQRGTYDVIHVHGLGYHAYVAVRAGRLLRKPVIVKLANSGPASDISKMKSGQRLFLSRHLLPTSLLADRFVALNQMIQTELEAEGVGRDRIVVIPNGVAVPELTMPSGLERTERVVTFIGRLHEQKAVDVLIRGFAALPESTKQKTALLIVGDGPVRTSLERLAENLGEETRIEFRGEVDDVGPSLRETTLLVLPSIAEGMSNTLLEAMVRGIPVIASDIPPNAVLIEHGETGWLFPPSDAKALTTLLDSVLDDVELLTSVGERARGSIVAHYDIMGIAQRYAGLYRELCGEQE